MHSRTRHAVIGAMAISLVAAACGSSNKAETVATTVAAAAGATDAATTVAADAATTAPAGTDAAATTAAATGSAGVCPEKLVIQTDWWPEIEHGGTYQLIGPNGTADKKTFRYSGPIEAKYAVGGIKTVEVRAGGDAISFNPVAAEMYTKDEITLGYVNLSDIAKFSKSSAVVAVAKTLEINPQELMWDPAQVTIDKPEDIAASGFKVLHFDKTTYIDWMIAKGYIKESQTDPTYGGAPDTWIASAGKIIQQGFATNEIYSYEHSINWKDGKPAPVKYLLVDSIGFRDYPAAISVRKDKLAALSPCLKLLIPKMAQAWVDFIKDPKPMADKLTDITTTYDTYWHVNADINDSGLKLAADQKITANGPAGDYCSLDEKRSQDLITELGDVFTKRGIEAASDMSAKTLVDNEFCAGAPGV